MFTNTPYRRVKTYAATNGAADIDLVADGATPAVTGAPVSAGTAVQGAPGHHAGKLRVEGTGILHLQFEDGSTCTLNVTAPYETNEPMSIAKILHDTSTATNVTAFWR